MRTETVDIEAIRARCTRPIDVRDLYDRLHRLGMEYGPEFRGVHALWIGRRECIGLVQTRAATGGRTPAAGFSVDPPLLDACFQTLLLSTVGDDSRDDGCYVVLGLRSLTLFDELPSELWCWCRWDDDKTRGPVTVGDLQVLDRTGRVLGDVHELRIMKTPLAAASSTRRAESGHEAKDARPPSTHDLDLFFGIAWRPLSTAAAKPSALDSQGHWLVVGDAVGPADDLVRALEERGQHCSRCPTDSESLRAAIGAFSRERSKRGVIFADGASARGFVDLPPHAVTDGLEESCDGLRRLLWMLAQAGVSHLEHGLAVLTWAASAVVADDVVEPLQSGLSAYTRVAAWEHARLGIRWVDLPRLPELAGTAALLHAVTADRREWQIAVRGERLYGARLERRAADASPDPPPSIQPGATYLITGGQGGLGLEVARWLAACGAGCVVLLSRRAPTAAVEAVRAEIEAHGCALRLAQGDVTSASDVRRAMLTDDDVHPKVRGVFHAATVLNNALLTQETRGAFREVVRPKVVGAYHLHRAATEAGLDFIVHFSSATSALGLRGQGSYAAANGVLDALACSPPTRATKTFAINWGTWGEVGKAARMKARGEGLIWKWGVRDITPTEGIQALATVLSGRDGQTAVMRWDWKQLAAAAPHSRAFFEDLITATADPSTPVPEDECASEFVARLQATSPGSRHRLIESYLQAHVAKVLGLPAEELPSVTQPLMEQGVDSLMAVDLRAQLGRDFDQRLEPTLVFDYPTIDALARRLEASVPTADDTETPSSATAPESLAATRPPTRHGPPDAPPPPPCRLDDATARALRLIEGLTDEEAAEMLRRSPKGR